MKRYDEAIARASPYAERYGEDLTILDVLKVAHFYTGKIEEAIRYGQRGIEMRDAEACRLPAAGTLTEPGGPPSGQNVISFSLWGAAPYYGYGAMINLVLEPHGLSGLDLPLLRRRVGAARLRRFPADNGADVRKIEDEYPGVGCSSAFW